MKGVNMGEAQVLKETAKAILVRIEEIPTEDYWIPKSQIHDDSEVYEEGTDGDLIVSDWLAEKNGWD